MRIGLFTDTYAPHVNGVATSVEMLKKGLEKEGHIVYVVTVNSSSIRYQYSDKTKIMRIPGIKTKIYDYRLTFTYPLKAANIVRKWDLDVIHSHTDFGVGTFAKIIAKQHNIPLIYTYHTMYEDYVHYITKGYFSDTSKFIVKTVTKLLCDKIVSELVVPTEKAKELFVAKYHCNREINVVSNGVELEKFYKESHSPKKVAILKKKLGIKDNDFVIVFVGRIASEKNIQFLIETHKELVKVDSKFKLLLIGDGPEKDDYVKLAKKLEISDKVIFAGKVLFKDVALYYQMGNVFATASQSETQGMTVFEGMAASLPAICIEDDSYRQMVKDGQNGKFFKTKKDYVKVMVEIEKDKKLYKELAINAKESAEPFSNTHYAKKMAIVYEKAIKENPRGGLPIVEALKKIGKRALNDKNNNR